jgi:hypothetical protein
MNNEFINAFKKSAALSQAQLNEEVSIMQSGIAEILWISLKEEAGDMDEYIVQVNKMYDHLRDGYYDFTNDQGQPVPRMKPAKVRHALLTSLLEGISNSLGEDTRYDLSIDGLKKLAARRDERKKTRVLSSGSKKQREQFEGNRKQLAYAGNLDDRGEVVNFKRA